MSEIYRQYESAAQCADAEKLLELQKKLLLPIIAEEKEAFISAEFGRLQQIMGVEYTDGDEIKVFHPLPEELKNPNVKIAGIHNTSFTAKYTVADVEGEHYFEGFRAL